MRSKGNFYIQTVDQKPTTQIRKEHKRELEYEKFDGYGQCRMMINGIQFIQVLLEANGLAAGKDHQFKGRYDAEKNAVIISLEKDEQSALSPQKCTT